MQVALFFQSAFSVFTSLACLFMGFEVADDGYAELVRLAEHDPQYTAWVVQYTAESFSVRLVSIMQLLACAQTTAQRGVHCWC